MEIDDLDSLSNTELRAKCVEAGLPNVPVTDSSRKLLVKRLRMSLGGVPSSQTKKSNRRETIHVSNKVNDTAVASPKKPAKDENARPSQRVNSRRTISTAPSSVKDAVDTSSAIPAPISNRRRSTREYSVPIAPKPVEDRPYIILESDEEDNDLVIAAENAEKGNQGPNRQDVAPVRSRSRASSLAKSSVVTTSFSSETNAKPAVTLQDVMEDDENVVSDTARRETISNFESQSSRSMYPDLRQYVEPPVDHSIPLQTERPSLSSYALPQSRASVNRVPQPAHQASNPSYSYGQFPLYSTTATDSTAHIRAYNEPIDYYARHGGLSSNGATSTTSSITRRTIATTKPVETAHFIEHSDGEGPYETPFLSSFARSLERQKAEPLSPMSEALFTRRAHRSQARDITGRKPVGSDASFFDLVRQFILTMEEKYHLKRYFALLLTVLLALLVFVIFFL